jgi:hypothetical protein
MATCTNQSYVYKAVNPAPPGSSRHNDENNNDFCEYNWSSGISDNATLSSGVFGWPAYTTNPLNGDFYKGYSNSLQTGGEYRNTAYATNLTSQGKNECFCNGNVNSGSTSNNDPILTALALSTPLTSGILSTDGNYTDITKVGKINIGTTTNITVSCVNDSNVQISIDPFTQGIIEASIGLSFDANNIWKTLVSQNANIKLDHRDPILRWLFPQSQSNGTPLKQSDSDGYPITSSGYGSVNLDAWQCSNLQTLLTNRSNGSFPSPPLTDGGGDGPPPSPIDRITGSKYYGLTASDLWSHCQTHISDPNGGPTTYFDTYMDIEMVVPNYCQSSLILGSVSLPDLARTTVNNPNINTTIKNAYGNLSNFTNAAINKVGINSVNIYYNSYLYPGYIILVSGLPIELNGQVVQRSICNAWGATNIGSVDVGSQTSHTTSIDQIYNDIDKTLTPFANSDNYSLDYGTSIQRNSNGSGPVVPFNIPAQIGNASSTVYNYTKSTTGNDQLSLNNQYSVPGLYMLRISLDQLANTSSVYQNLTIRRPSTISNSGWTSDTGKNRPGDLHELVPLIQGCFDNIHSAYVTIQTDLIHNMLISILSRRLRYSKSTDPVGTVTSLFDSTGNPKQLTLSSLTLGSLSGLFMVAWTNPYNMSGRYSYVNPVTGGNILYTALTLNEIKAYANAFFRSSSSVTAFYGTMQVYIPYGYPGLNGNLGAYTGTTLIINTGVTNQPSQCSGSTLVATQQYIGGVTPNPIANPPGFIPNSATCVAAFWTSAYYFVFNFMGFTKPPPTPGTSTGGLPKWALIAIIIGAILFVIVIGWIIIIVTHPKKKTGQYSQQSYQIHV